MGREFVVSLTGWRSGDRVDAGQVRILMDDQATAFANGADLCRRFVEAMEHVFGDGWGEVSHVYEVGVGPAITVKSVEEEEGDDVL